MLRHVFIINVKEGISDDIVEQKVLEMRSMKEKIKVIDTIIAGRTRGLFGRPDAVMMVVDFKDKMLSMNSLIIRFMSAFRSGQQKPLMYKA